MEDYFQMINKNRDIANDLCKGLAILLVIVGHILPMHHYLRVWIYTFHMPLFFFLAGMTYKPRPIGDLISNSIKRLLVPFAICLLGAICLHLLSCDFEMVLARSVGFIFPDGLKYSLEVYILHLFFLFPMYRVGEYVLRHANDAGGHLIFFVQTTTSLIVSVVIVYLCYLVMNIINKSSLLSLLLLGRKSEKHAV